MQKIQYFFRYFSITAAPPNPVFDSIILQQNDPDVKKTDRDLTGCRPLNPDDE